MTPADFAAECIAKCAEGFDNEHAWLSWRQARLSIIRQLPRPLQNKIAVAWEQSGPKGSSR